MTTKRDGLEPRGPNTWRIVVAGGRDPETGEYVRIRETFHGTKTEARRRRDDLRTQVARGTIVHAERESVSDYLERWIAGRELSGKVRPKTAAVYRGYVRREITPRIGSMRLSDVRPVHCQTVLDEARKGGLSARSVVQVHAIMRGAFRSAVRLQVMAVDPTAGATPPRVEAAELTTPTAADVARLLAEVNPEYRTALSLAAGSGLRRGELLAIRWGSVELDSDRPRLRVEGTLQRANGVLVVLPPKTERSRRVVPISASVAAALRQLRADQRERRMLAGPAWHPGDYMFDRGDGRPIDPDAFGRAFRVARATLGLDSVRLHDLRHGLATMLVDNGTNVRTVSDLLGHATVAFTLQTYVHPDEATAVAAIDDAERLLGG